MPVDAVGKVLSCTHANSYHCSVISCHVLVLSVVEKRGKSSGLPTSPLGCLQSYVKSSHVVLFAFGLTDGDRGDAQGYIIIQSRNCHLLLITTVPSLSCRKALLWRRMDCLLLSFGLSKTNARWALLFEIVHTLPMLQTAFTRIGCE